MLKKEYADYDDDDDDDDDNGLSCFSCPYCDKNYGLCRRYAPRFVGTNITDKNFPKINDELDWCGEHPDFKNNQND